VKRADQIAGAILLVVFLMVFYQSTKLDLVYRNSPGAGFFPLWLSVFALAATAVITVGAIRRPAALDRPVRWPRGIGLRRIGLTLVAFILYVYLVTIVGFILSTTGFMLFMGRMLGFHRWYQLVAVSVLTAVGLFLVFQVWLQMELPTGRVAIP
jgi:putative tricarboxylic transport membrane protein